MVLSCSYPELFPAAGASALLIPFGFSLLLSHPSVQYTYPSLHKNV